MRVRYRLNDGSVVVSEFDSLEYSKYTNKQLFIILMQKIQMNLEKLSLRIIMKFITSLYPLIFWNMGILIY